MLITHMSSDQSSEWSSDECPAKDDVGEEEVVAAGWEEYLGDYVAEESVEGEIVPVEIDNTMCV